MAKLSTVRITDEGRWFTYYEDPEGEVPSIEFLVGSTASASFKRKERKLAQRHMDRNPGARFSGQGVSLSENALQVMQIDLAKELCQDWRGIENDDGTIDEYSDARKEEILNDPNHGDIVAFLHQCGNNLAAHTQAAKEEAVKNSPTASAT